MRQLSLKATKLFLRVKNLNKLQKKKCFNVKLMYIHVDIKVKRIITLQCTRLKREEEK